MATGNARYEPTPRKLADIRRRGEVPQSRELNSAVVLVSGLLVLWISGDRLVDVLRRNFASVYSAIQTGDATALQVLQSSAFRTASVLLSFFVLLFVVGFFTCFFQVGPLFSLHAVSPQASRIEPAKRLSRLFSGWFVIDVAMITLKLASVACVFWLTLKHEARGLFGLMRSDLQSSMIAFAGLVFDLCVRVAVALAVIGVIDFFYQRYRFRQSQKMTREEVAREQREIYGDPLVRQRRNRMYQEVVEYATLEETANATALVYSSTRFAVALRYRPDDAGWKAPKLAAKGEKALAQRMIHTAILSAIPAVEDLRLTMALYRLETGKEIPQALYPEVAAVITRARAR
ncbi:MAG: EscU/YscU/HrcU family type III secretion system export apparatus switch protein [Deltaproteobacteria bacterium]|nr:EscU/YscU/HrcU family type III secretion system export apparatus switch protein [Deltaproteobacteria bacterium]